MEVLGWRCWGGSICVLCHTYRRAQVTLPRREWSGESDVKPGGKEQCLGAWDITLGRGCLRGDRGTGGYGGETGPLPVAGRGFHWKCCMQLTSTHSWPANSCTQQAVPLRCPHGPEHCCQLTLPLQGTKLYECRDVTSGHDPESRRALSSGLSHRADHASATTQTNTSLL